MSQEQKPRKTALGYIRISDKKQIEGESPETQRRKIQEYADDNNIEILEWFYDEAKSGKNTDREELQNMLNMAKKLKGKINFILVYKMSRASRNIETFVTDIVSVLAPLKISIMSVTERFDDTTSMGRFMRYLQVLVDQYDNENKRDMVVDNMTSIAQQGYWQHHPPRGYKRARVKNYDGKKRTTITPNHEAPKLKDLLMRWNRGDLIEAELMRYATSINLLNTNGQPMKQEAIHRIITNPIYAGWVCCSLTDNKRVDGKHEGLISREVFEQNQLILKLKDKDYMQGLKREKNNELYPLRRFVRCVHCKHYMTASRPNNSPRYYCHRPSCSQSGSIMTREIHEQFEALLAKITPTEGTLKLLKEIVKRQNNKELGNINGDLKRVHAALEATNVRRQKIINKFVDEKLTQEEKELAIKGVDADRTDLQKELFELEQRQTISESSIDYALGFMVDISKNWSNAPLRLKQTYQELVFPDGFTYDIKHQNFITPAISPLYRVELGKAEAINVKNFGLVSHVDITWNSFLSYLVTFADRLEDLGFRYVDSEVFAPGEEMSEK